MQKEKDQFIFPVEYWEEELKYVRGCLGDRVWRQLEQREADSQAAREAFPQKGDIALPEFLRNLPSRLKSPYVFPSHSGKTPLNAHNFINRVWNPLLQEAGIADFHCHDRRHTFASRLIMASVDLRTVQELMGHKTITMTLCYAHLSPTHQREAVQRLTPQPTATTTAISPKVA